MALTSDVTSQFAKLTTPKKEKTETTINGTVKIINGKEYVQLDGSDILTPVISTVAVDNDDRVKVLIKEHSATVTGNITSPSARSKDISTIKDTVDEFGNTIKQMDNSITQFNNSIVQMDNTINQQNNIINQHGDSIQSQQNTIIQIQNNITEQGNTILSMNNDVISMGNQISEINNTVDSQNNTITAMNNTVISLGNTIESCNNTIKQQGNTIEQFGNNIVEINSNIKVQDSSINILNSGFNIVDGKLTGLSKIVVDALTTAVLNTGYAKIDFANIEMAAITKVFSDSGIIKDLITQDGHITGELVGVTIKGDLIEANTIKADKLVVQGENGLYYKLNLNSLGEATVESHDKYQNGLDGSVIIAKSVTADRIQVTDLVAFGATIGGFTIKNHAIHSNLKTSIDSESNGIFLGDDGQLSFGNEKQYIKHYKDTEGKWHIEISTNEFKIKTGVTEDGQDVYKQITDYVSTEIKTSEKGLTQTFRSEINPISQTVDEWSGYIYTGIGTDENDKDTLGRTYMLLGNTNSDYKVRIVNNSLSILFHDDVTSNWQNDLFTVDKIKSTSIEADQLSIGHFAFVTNPDGSVSFRKIK